MRQKIFWIIALCVVSLVGLLVCQTMWIKRAMLLADEQYGHRVVFALHTLSDDYTQLAQQAADRDTVSKRSSIIADDPIDRVLLDSLLKHYVDGNKLSPNYEYSIVQLLDSTSAAADAEVMAGCYRVPIKPAHRSAGVTDTIDYQLQLVFPDKLNYIASEMWHWLIFSVVFIMAVALSLAYIVRSVIRQKQRSVEQSDFINSMIHELKTPIATIGMSSKVLKEAGKSVTNFDKLRNYAEIVEEENKRSLACVESLLQMLTVNKRSLTLNKEWIDINAVISTTIDSFSVAGRSARFTLLLDDRVKNIFADKMHVRGVLDNLIENAIKYSAADGCEIYVRTEWEGSNVVIFIEDKGKGMASKDVKHVFEKFYRSSAAKKRGVKGFGLGMYYVKQVVEAHNGRVFVKSILNKGTTIGVILPIEKQNI